MYNKLRLNLNNKKIKNFNYTLIFMPLTFKTEIIHKSFETN